MEQHKEDLRYSMLGYLHKTLQFKDKGFWKPNKIFLVQNDTADTNSQNPLTNLQNLSLKDQV